MFLSKVLFHQGFFLALLGLISSLWIAEGLKAAWDSGSDGGYNTARWNVEGINGSVCCPAPSMEVTIKAPGTYTVNLKDQIGLANNISIGGADGQQKLKVEGPTSNLNTLSGTTVENNGVLAISNGGTVSSPDTGSQSTEVTVNPGGTLTADGSANVEGDVQNSGSISAEEEAKPFDLHIDKDFLQSPQGEIVFWVGGTTPGETHSQLSVNNSVYFNGTVKVMIAFEPTEEVEIVLVTFKSMQGEFQNVVVEQKDKDTKCNVSGQYKQTSYAILVSSCQKDAESVFGPLTAVIISVIVVGFVAIVALSVGCFLINRKKAMQKYRIQRMRENAERSTIEAERSSTELERSSTEHPTL
jgi:hypothetical protein